MSPGFRVVIASRPGDEVGTIWLRRSRFSFLPVLPTAIPLEPTPAPADGDDYEGKPWIVCDGQRDESHHGQTAHETDLVAGYPVRVSTEPFAPHK
jgi:hypothetical protein